jgi:hypothetical protein
VRRISTSLAPPLYSDLCREIDAIIDQMIDTDSDQIPISEERFQSRFSLRVFVLGETRCIHAYM